MCCAFWRYKLRGNLALGTEFEYLCCLLGFTLDCLDNVYLTVQIKCKWECAASLQFLLCKCCFLSTLPHLLGKVNLKPIFQRLVRCPP